MLKWSVGAGGLRIAKVPPSTARAPCYTAGRTIPNPRPHRTAESQRHDDGLHLGVEVEDLAALLAAPTGLVETRQRAMRDRSSRGNP